MLHYMDNHQIQIDDEEHTDDYFPPKEDYVVRNDKKENIKINKVKYQYLHGSPF